MTMGGERVGFVQTATIHGVEALPVTVEISIGSGLPGFYIIGLPDLAVKEATRRVRQALRSSGFAFKNALVVVNLAPSALRKAGSGFDLPIALAYLVATGQIDKSLIDGRICVGELSLDGSVRAVAGQLAFERLAGLSHMGLMTGPAVRGYADLGELGHCCLKHLSDLAHASFSAAEPATSAPANPGLDFADIAGNDLAKRALALAAAGGHGLMLIGPPGAGKSMMARRLPSILPPLHEADRLESALIHSVAGLPYQGILAGQRPFRSPHHGASRAGMVGGGNPILPGEISLAHNGVLFLDELPEFSGAVLQLLRQPIELGYISLARAAGTVTFPASFMLVAAANPCPCGFLGDDQRSCACTPAQVSRYQGRIGGPLLDRINLVVDVRRSPASEVLASGHGTSSAQLKADVDRARGFAQWRDQAQMGSGANDTAATTPGATANADADAADAEASTRPHGNLSEEARILAACQLGRREQAFLEMAADRYALSGRGIISTLAVARTIADMEEASAVSQDHLMEAIGYRPRGSR
jgi:magnesium chelatase family protein